LIINAERRPIMGEWELIYTKYAEQVNLDTMPDFGIKRGCCRECGTPLSTKEMWPPGKASRDMCVPCYERKFNRINYDCVECGESLPQEKIDAQRMNYREIHNHLCDKRSCEAIWSYKHVLVTGLHPYIPLQKGQIPVRIDPNYPIFEDGYLPDVPDISELPDLPESPYLEEPEDPEVIDCEYTECPDFPQLEDRRFLLPEPYDSLRFPDFFQKPREKEKVALVPLKKRKGW
jgi:hypothetical protein